MDVGEHGVGISVICRVKIMVDWVFNDVPLVSENTHIVAISATTDVICDITDW
jgi:hypothetical protein